MPCVHDWKLLHQPGAPQAPLGPGEISLDMTGLSRTLDGVSLEAVGASLGRSPWEGCHAPSPPSSQPVFSRGPFPLGSFPTAQHEQCASSISLTFSSGVSVS